MGSALSYFDNGQDAVQEQPFDPSTVYAIPRIDIPLDESDKRYAKCFTSDQTTELSEFFREYGFVVIRDVLTEDECRASIDELWTFLESRGYKLREWDGPTEHEKQMDEERPPARIRRDDPSTWDNDWPPMGHAGILGYLPVFRKQVLQNRQNPKIYSAFATLMQRQDLLVNQGRLGMFRPTRVKDEPDTINQKWKTAYSLHWDLNPWRYSLDDAIFQRDAKKHQKESQQQLTYEEPCDFIKENSEIGSEKDGSINVQGLINFADNQVEDGGFQIVVGCHHHMAKWADSCKESMGVRMRHRTLVKVDCDDPLYGQPQRVAMRAGSMVIWDQRMAHGSAPNDSCNPRMCQFIKVLPAYSGTSQARNRARVVQQKVAEAKGFEATDLGNRLFGLAEWS
eukprot:scpid72172/ scgid26841/ 